MKKKILSLSIIAILIMMLFLLTGCGNKENENNQDNQDSQDNIEQQNQISQEEALGIVTNLIRPTYSTAYIEKIDVDITTENINNESYLNYYVFRTIIGEDFYTSVVNKNTSKVYLFDENNQNNLQEITQDNMTKYIKITKYIGNGYTISIKDNGNCHLSIDTRAGADDGEYADEDGTYIIENSKITVTLSSSKKYEFNITDLNTITIIEQEKASSEFGVGTYKAKETGGEFVIQIKENNKCHFQAQSPFLDINSDGTYTLSNNAITFKLNSGKTISCSIKNNNQIYWSDESMTFFKN